MSDNPTCPYCGKEMRYRFFAWAPQILHVYFECPSCGSESPQYPIDPAATEQEKYAAAYAAAMKRAECENAGTDYSEVDQFICSECGIHLQDWVRIDEDDYEDGIVHEYVFQFCPNCGKKVKEE